MADILPPQLCSSGRQTLSSEGPDVGPHSARVFGVTTSAPNPQQGQTGQSFADASPAEVRAALIPEEAAEFDLAWRAVMATATETLDPTEVFATLDSWRRVARLTAAAGAQAHRAMYHRVASALTGEPVPADEPLTEVKARLGL
jgi:Family of unknown function (DUF6247)